MKPKYIYFLTGFLIFILFFNGQEASAQFSKNYTKTANKKRASKRQKSVANQHFGRASRGGSVYINGTKVIGLEGLKTANRLNVNAFGEYYFNEQISTNITAGYLRTNYFNAHRNNINLFADAKYSLYNINSTIYFGAILGVASTFQTIGNIELIEEKKKLLIGPTGAFEVRINFLSDMAINAKVRQVFFMNDEFIREDKKYKPSLFLLTFGFTKTL